MDGYPIDHIAISILKVYADSCRLTHYVALVDYHHIALILGRSSTFVAPNGKRVRATPLIKSDGDGGALELTLPLETALHAVERPVPASSA